MGRVRMQAGLVIAGLVLAATVARGGGFDHALPEGTLVYVAVDDVATFRSSFQSSPFGQFLADEASATMVESVLGRLTSLADAAEEEGGVNLMQLLGRVEGPLALGFHAAGEESELVISLFAAMGQQAGTTVADLDRRSRRQVEQEGALLASEKHAGMPVSVLVSPGADGAVSLRYGDIQGTVFVQITASGVDGAASYGAAVERLGGTGGPSLSTNPRYAATRSQQEERGVRLFVDVRGFLDHALDQEATSPGKFRDLDELSRTLGLATLGALTGSVQLGEGGHRSLVRIGWTGDSALAEVTRGYLGSGDLSLLSWVPAEVLSAVNLRLDLGRGTDALIAALATQEALEVDVSTLFDESLGFDPREVLFPLLDGQLALFSAEVEPAEAMPGFDGSQNVALLVGLRDGPRFTALVDSVLRGAGFAAARRSEEYLGFEVFTVPVFPLTVSYAVLDDLAIVSLSPTLLREVLRRRADPELPSLASKPSFAGALEQVGGELSLISYVDEATTMRTVVSSLCALAVAEDVDAALLEVAPEPPAWTPSTEVIRRYFDGALVFTLSVAESGVTWRSLDT